MLFIVVRWKNKNNIKLIILSILKFKQNNAIII